MPAQHDEREYHVAEVRVALRRARREGQSVFQEDAQQLLVGGRRGEVFAHHDVAGAEHGVAHAVGEAALVAQQVLHGNLEIAFVADSVGKLLVVQYAVGAEHLVAEFQASHLLQFHHADGSQEFRHRCNAHDVAWRHGLASLLVGPPEAFAEEQRVVPCDGQLCAFNLPSAQVLLNFALHGLECGAL